MQLGIFILGISYIILSSNNDVLILMAWRKKSMARRSVSMI